MPDTRRLAPAQGALAARAQALAERRVALGRSLTARFWLRFHASVIVSGTFATGFLVNAALLQWPVHGVWMRWTVAVLAGYAAFFGLVRLWLAYVGAKPLVGDASGGNGWGVDAVPSGRGGGTFSGGGGSSGGAGASASFDAPTHAMSSSQAAGGNAPPGTGRAGSFGGLVDGVGDVDGDGVLLVVLGVIALALVAALVGGAVHLVWIAPEMLTDAAFGAMLASGAVPGMRRLREPDWSGHVLVATLPVLAAVMAVAWAGAWAFTHWFPGLRTLGEAWRMLL